MRKRCLFGGVFLFFGVLLDRVIFFIGSSMDEGSAPVWFSPV